MKKYVLVICINSLMESDFDMLKGCDNFKYIISEGAVVKKVLNQYPNLKAPASTSILTGEPPSRHGIYFDNSDFLLKKYREKEYEDICVPTILDIFVKNGFDVSTIFWPIMGNNNAKYNFLNIKSSKIKDIVDGIFKGSAFYMLKNIFKYVDIFKINMQPENDNFSSILAMELFEKDASNIIFLNFNYLDYVRRIYSDDQERIFNAIKNIDHRIGDILNWCGNKNISKNLTTFIVSNGGVYDSKSSINLNYAFLRGELLKVNKKGKIKDYTAYAHCDGGSAFVYLKNPDNINDYGKVKVFLDDFLKENSEFVEGIYEVKDYESSDLNKFSFRLESKPNCMFDGSCNKSDFIEEINFSKCFLNSKVNKSFCGFSSKYENSNGLFIGYGDRINNGVVVEKCNIEDIAPTIASFLDLDFKCSGRVIEGIRK